MPVISTCPRCQKQVSIPAGIDSAALVRCPLCNAEYPLSEAIPPELIPVAAATVSESVPAADLAIESVAKVEDEFAAAVEEEVEEPAVFAEEEIEEHAGIEEEMGEHAAFAEEVGTKNTATSVAGLTLTATARRRRRPPKPWWQTPLEVISGGLAGCLFAYYGLVFWFGPEFKSIGLPQLPLPGVTWLTTPADELDAEGEKPDKAKPKNAGTPAAKRHTSSRKPNGLAPFNKTSDGLVRAPSGFVAPPGLGRI